MNRPLAHAGIPQAVDTLLAIFEAHGVRGTFFVLGKLAERFPKLVAEIADAGHEVGSHGWSHRAVFQIGLEAFEDEVVRSVALLADITGKPVRGFRAPDFSITRRSLWALDVLVKHGLQYDSSIFPVELRRYGIGDSLRTIHRRENGLIEVPLSCVEWGGRRWPVAGGG